ncbi:hypothetical protein SAMN05421780_1048 [Flexibacter flexilis DSM 6793]|uniref:Uncharacterized protein n=1 Tax=Flexibacter flexilis DSM 6793 TaxID=927664 RepID=A0A1I1HRW8_9BACT|nr:nuclear transport factor 2 family protein [Flexibacter flexilis]SFC24718.1 hypothetical protein SAMN05421780_1048 [Flexibacter flexilis DSM 6793]
MATTTIQSILDIFEGADERNWQKASNAMANKVLLDYTSMTGGEPALLTPQEITAAWANFLPGFDKTHHQLSNFQQQANTVTFDGKADHYINDSVWTVIGNYYAETEADGKVSLLRFNFKTQSGNTELPAIATANIQKSKVN